MSGNTLSELQTLSTESMLAGVVDEIINADPVLPRIPFETLNGTQKTYVRESTLPTPQFYDVDEVLTEGVPTFAQVTVSLEQIGMNSDTPGIADTLENVNAQRAIKLRQIAKALLERVGNRVVYANNTSNTKEFNGLHALTPSAQSTAEGSTATGSALNLSNLDTTIHLVKNGRIQVMTMTREIHRRFSAFVNTSNSNTPIRIDKNDFGVFVRMYNEIPMEFSDRQVQTETIASSTFSAETGGATSSVFLLQFGMPDSATPGIFGLQGEGGDQLIPIGWLEDKDHWRDRIRWRLAMGLGSTLAIGRVDGITDAAVAA